MAALLYEELYSSVPLSPPPNPWALTVWTQFSHPKCQPVRSGEQGEEGRRQEMKIFLRRGNLSSKGCFRARSGTAAAARPSPSLPPSLNVSHRYISFALSPLPRYLGEGKAGLKSKATTDAARRLGLGKRLDSLARACALNQSSAKCFQITN